MKLISSRAIYAVFALTSISCNLYAEEDAKCKELKSKILTSEVQGRAAFDELNSRIASNDQCSKNILGIMFAQGVLVEKSFNKAYSIFSDLSDMNYPPAQFNLALLVSKQSDHSEESLVNYLLGLSIKYIRTREWGYIGTSARDLAREYLQTKKSSNVNNEKYIAIESTFENSLKNEMFDIHQAFVTEKNEEKAFADGIASILMIGLAATKLSSMAAKNRAFPRAFNPAIPIMQNRLYHVTPIGGNMLYLSPLN